MLLLWFRLRYDCVHVRQWLTRPKCMSFPLFCWQFSCCGSTGPQSWITLNPGAIEGDGNRPPSCAPCALTETNCEQYDYISNTTRLPVSFNAFNVVRWLGWLLVNTAPHILLLSTPGLPEYSNSCSLYNWRSWNCLWHFRGVHIIMAFPNSSLRLLPIFAYC